MAAQILATKLYTPPIRPKLIHRPRLIEHLNEGLHRKLTLISAPAGFGKTTLISEWIAGCSRPAAWLSLDEADHEPLRFVAYLIAALGAASPATATSEQAEIGQRTLSELQSSQPPPINTLLTTLLNEIAASPNPLLLVLDDYHRIDSPAVDEALGFLLEHLPPQLHLVIATREDPPLPLARLRVRNQLTELRIADLRFTLKESADFLNQTMGLSLTAEDVATLENGTEGWIAGLQLAALSLQGRSNTAAFIQAFTGSHHYILDYLVEEVLQRQPEAVRSFLLQTAILDRLNGSLCAAVTGNKNSKQMLDSLERGNLFVVPLDDAREWYRYHHLFADVLRARALETQPDLLPTLHQRASTWYAANGLRPTAIDHALAAEDFEQAATLVELSWREMDRNYQEIGMRWLRKLPDALIDKRPVLNVAYAWALLSDGRLEEAERRLHAVERWLADGASSTDMIIEDQDERDSLPATLASARTYLALAQGDRPATIRYAQQTLDLLPEDDHFERAIPSSLLGLAQWAEGDLDSAHDAFETVALRFWQSDYSLHAIGAGFVAALIRAMQGRLRDATAALEKLLTLSAEIGQPAPRGTADLHVTLSDICRERNELDSAENHLAISDALGASAVLPGNAYRWYVAKGQLEAARANYPEALKLLDEAIRLQRRDPIPDINPIAALKARLFVQMGDSAEALKWAHTQKLSAADELTYLREFEHITLARVLLAEQRVDEALGLLGRLWDSAETGQRNSSLIDIGLLQAVGFEAKGERQEASVALERALILAEPEGYVRRFVEVGQPIATLLAAQKNTARKPYVQKLLAAFGNDSSPQPPTTNPQKLEDPLSERELEVLHLIAQGLSNREISERLFLAIDTVKGHNRKIFAKLHVQRRTEAVARARELGLVQQ